MIDDDLKRMFEDDTCSAEERELLSTIRGQTVDESFYEWHRAIKLDAVMSEFSIIESIDRSTPFNNSYDNFSLIAIKISRTMADDIFFRRLKECEGVEFHYDEPPYMSTMWQYHSPGRMIITITFNSNELSVNDFLNIEHKMKSQFNF